MQQANKLPTNIVHRIKLLQQSKQFNNIFYSENSDILLQTFDYLTQTLNVKDFDEQLHRHMFLYVQQIEYPISQQLSIQLKIIFNNLFLHKNQIINSFLNYLFFIEKFNSIKPFIVILQQIIQQNEEFIFELTLSFKVWLQDYRVYKLEAIHQIMFEKKQYQNVFNLLFWPDVQPNDLFFDILDGEVTLSNQIIQIEYSTGKYYNVKQNIFNVLLNITGYSELNSNYLEIMIKDAECRQMLYNITTSQLDKYNNYMVYYCRTYLFVKIMNFLIYMFSDEEILSLKLDIQQFQNMWYQQLLKIYENDLDKFNQVISQQQSNIDLSNINIIDWQLQNNSYTEFSFVIFRLNQFLLQNEYSTVINIYQIKYIQEKQQNEDDLYDEKYEKILLEAQSNINKLQNIKQLLQTDKLLVNEKTVQKMKKTQKDEIFQVYKLYISTCFYNHCIRYIIYSFMDSGKLFQSMNVIGFLFENLLKHVVDEQADELFDYQNEIEQQSSQQIKGDVRVRARAKQKETVEVKQNTNNLEKYDYNMTFYNYTMDGTKLYILQFFLYYQYYILQYKFDTHYQFNSEMDFLGNNRDSESSNNKELKAKINNELIQENNQLLKRIVKKYKSQYLFIQALNYLEVFLNQFQLQINYAYQPCSLETYKWLDCYHFDQNTPKQYVTNSMLIAKITEQFDIQQLFRRNFFCQTLISDYYNVEIDTQNADFVTLANGCTSAKIYQVNGIQFNKIYEIQQNTCYKLNFDQGKQYYQHYQQCVRKYQVHVYKNAAFEDERLIQMITSLDQLIMNNLQIQTIQQYQIFTTNFDVQLTTFFMLQKQEIYGVYLQTIKQYRCIMSAIDKQLGTIIQNQQNTEQLKLIEVEIKCSIEFQKLLLLRLFSISTNYSTMDQCYFVQQQQFVKLLLPKFQEITEIQDTFLKETQITSIYIYLSNIPYYLRNDELLIKTINLLLQNVNFQQQFDFNQAAMFCIYQLVIYGTSYYLQQIDNIQQLLDTRGNKTKKQDHAPILPLQKDSLSKLTKDQLVKMQQEYMTNILNTCNKFITFQQQIQKLQQQNFQTLDFQEYINLQEMIMATILHNYNTHLVKYSVKDDIETAKITHYICDKTTINLQLYPFFQQSNTNDIAINKIVKQNFKLAVNLMINALQCWEGQNCNASSTLFSQCTSFPKIKITLIEVIKQYDEICGLLYVEKQQQLQLIHKIRACFSQEDLENYRFLIYFIYECYKLLFNITDDEYLHQSQTTITIQSQNSPNLTKKEAKQLEKDNIVVRRAQINQIYLLEITSILKSICKKQNQKKNESINQVQHDAQQHSSQLAQTSFKLSIDSIEHDESQEEYSYRQNQYIINKQVFQLKQCGVNGFDLYLLYVNKHRLRKAQLKQQFIVQKIQINQTSNQFFELQNQNKQIKEYDLNFFLSRKTYQQQINYNYSLILQQYCTDVLHCLQYKSLSNELVQYLETKFQQEENLDVSNNISDLIKYQVAEQIKSNIFSKITSSDYYSNIIEFRNIIDMFWDE